MKLWYDGIKRRANNASDYELDMLFCNEAGRSGAERLRVFEKIRQDSRVPSSSLLAKVEAHPQFKGLREVFNAEFWTLARDLPADFSDATDSVVRALSSCGLDRIEYGDDHALKRAFPGQRPNDVYLVCLRYSLNDLEHRLEQLELLAALHREASLANSLPVLDILSSLFDQCAELYFTEVFGMSLGWQYLADANKSIIHAPRPAIAVSIVDGFDRAILPAGLAEEVRSRSTSPHELRTMLLRVPIGRRTPLL